MSVFKFSNLSNLYKSALLDDVMPFWMRNSLDQEYGGYFTCLERDGRVFDTDKFMWLQGRQVWMLSKLYNTVEKKQDWLEAARLGADFMRRHGRDRHGDWYFSLTREGRPLVQPYNIFSDCFAAMAFGQYAQASGDESAADLARQTYERILMRQANPKGQYNKLVPGTRPMRGFALPMILCNLALELEPVLEKDQVEQIIDRCLDEIINVFYRPDMELLLENLGADGQPVDSFEGRQVLPGHAIEGMWFVMDLAKRRGDMLLANRAVDIALKMAEYGWDKQHEGIFYFMDRLGRPPLQLEWDQKLWWVHIEALIAMASGFELTGRKECADWYKRLHEYSWNKFADPEYGEWFGYLNRRGEVSLSCKGTKFKGCFHVPRGLLKLWQIFERLTQIGGAW